MKIVYLYTEVMGYTMSTVKELVNVGFEVHIVYYDHKKLTPYRIPQTNNVHLYPRSSLNRKLLTALVEKLQPDFTVVSGWIDKDYLYVSSFLKKTGKVVVCGLDGQWNGTLRQYVAQVFGFFRYFHKYFTHAWVAGVYQFEYARKLGFKKKEIIFDLYSADITKFFNSYEKSLIPKKNKYPHRFLFVGRFEPVKGLNILTKAWKLLGDSKNDWELHLIGNGSLKEELSSISGIIIKDFLQPDELLAEIQKSGCFVLPSLYEPWGVVIHEFAAAGLPLITSDVVGSSSTFVIDGVNGFRFNNGSVDQLLKCLKEIISSSDTQLITMGQMSVQLANRITPITSSANLLSLAPRK
jgi:glycosyltransferase involved in cell wall biosynthesis